MAKLIAALIALSCYLSKPAPAFIRANRSSNSISRFSDSSINAGKLLFTKCANCHFIFKNGAGPALAGVEKRWPDRDRLNKFINDPNPFITKDEYVKDLVAKYRIITPAFKLTQKEVDCILDYIAFEESKKLPAAVH